MIFVEAHHATSPTYQAVLKYFNPQFTFRMTATPERRNQQNVFECCFGNSFK
ncbi:DEAD/DEAH box helicase family protein [Peribacillus frigoritolerans]|uniref:DEAD/DEAH box helicase family protein n=1 Tax=Peribacillus frigoritolerans TaxID=450367 RepID=UPI003CFEFE57